METSYKEKYEQALAKAKEQYNYPCMRSCMGILEEIFPELAESEDEKVRKEIVRFIQMEVEDEIVGNKWLAWLGKQKGNIWGISANWSEEDDDCLSTIIAEFSKCAGKSVSKDEWMRCNDFLNSLRDRVQTQSKQEWNEEDEQHIDSLLKRLDALCRNKFERTRFAISEDKDWLKSLRPLKRWKPSEGDIIILEKVIKGELEPKVFQATLHGMLEQLKKLKEE